MYPRLQGAPGQLMRTSLLCADARIATMDGFVQALSAETEARWWKDARGKEMRGRVGSQDRECVRKRQRGVAGDLGLAVFGSHSAVGPDCRLCTRFISFQEIRLSSSQRPFHRPPPSITATRDFPSSWPPTTPAADHPQSALKSPLSPAEDSTPPELGRTL